VGAAHDGAQASVAQELQVGLQHDTFSCLKQLKQLNLGILNLKHPCFSQVCASQQLFVEQPEPASAELPVDSTKVNANAHSMRCFSILPTPKQETESDRHSDGGRTLHRIYTMPADVAEKFRLIQ
jgi:hypothetical protein